MAYIKVTFADLENTKQAVDTYIRQTKTKMNTANVEVNTTMSSSWSGPDYDSFRAQWSKLGSKDSSTNLMLSELNSYAEYINFVKAQYKLAQDTAKALSLLIAL